MTSPASIERVESALKELAAAHRPITFTDIATACGIGRATLYRNPTLRALVEEYRVRQAEANTLSGLRAEISHLRGGLEAVADRVREHEERLRRIEGRQLSISG